MSRRKQPLYRSLDRVLVEPEAIIERPDNANIPDLAVGVDDGFELDVTLDFRPAGIIGVLRLDLPNELRRRDAVAGMNRALAEGALVLCKRLGNNPEYRE